MSLFKKLLGSSPDLDAQTRELGFEVSPCSQECGDCHTSFPKSLKFDESASLWNSTNPYGMHIVVSTAKTDWPHDATGTSKTLSHEVNLWASSASLDLEHLSKIKVTVGSMSGPGFENDPEYISEKKGEFLLLPFFVWVKNISVSEVKPFMNMLMPDLIEARKQQLPHLKKTLYEEFPHIVVEPDSHYAHVFLCSHKTRDKRCGVTAPIIKKEMDLHLRELGYLRDFGDTRPDGIKVSYINHIGGHKYAANVMIYTKKNGNCIWLALCKPNNCKPIIDECILQGKVWPEKVRIIQKFDPIEW